MGRASFSLYKSTSPAIPAQAFPAKQSRTASLVSQDTSSLDRTFHPTCAFPPSSPQPSRAPSAPVLDTAVITTTRCTSACRPLRRRMISQTSTCDPSMERGTARNSPDRKRLIISCLTSKIIAPNVPSTSKSALRSRRIVYLVQTKVSFRGSKCSGEFKTLYRKDMKTTDGMWYWTFKGIRSFMC
jgi:hypothetical protein